jgi:peptide chain release factor subunit 1 (aeRF-1)
LNQYLYRCDDHFHVDILKDMLKDDNLIGFLAIDAKDAGWGLLHGDKIEVLSQNRIRGSQENIDKVDNLQKGFKN